MSHRRFQDTRARDHFGCQKEKNEKAAFEVFMPTNVKVDPVEVWLRETRSYASSHVSRSSLPSYTLNGRKGLMRAHTAVCAAVAYLSSIFFFQHGLGEGGRGEAGERGSGGAGGGE